MTWAVHWQVYVGGQDATIGMRPYLMEVETVDRAGVESDTCRLVFDDSRGKLFLPPPRTPIRVVMNGVTDFEGVVDSTPWRMTRGGGRVLEVHAKTFDTRGKATEPQFWHLDDATLGDALKKAGEKAGVSIEVDPELAATQRDYWSPGGASLIAWAEKLRQEFGATFKMRAGSQAAFAGRGKGTAVTGSALPVVAANAGPGGNVITVDIDPAKGRPRSKTRRVRFFDRKSATFKEKDVTVDLEDAGDGVDTQRWLAADEGQAETMAKGHKADAERNAGVGSIEMLLDPEARAEGGLQLTGARPGIDGLYRLNGVTKRADRNGGNTMRCELAQPQGGAGTDSRKPTSSALPSVPIPTPAPR